MTLLGFRSAYGMDGAPAPTPTAPTYVDGTTLVYDIDLDGVGPVSTYNIPAPTAGGPLLEGDLILSFHSWDTANTTLVGRTLPADWVSITGIQLVGTATTTAQYEAAYHFVTAAEAASPPSSWAMPNGAAYEGSLSVARYRGVDPADPLAVSDPAPGYSVAIQNTASTTKVAPAVTTDADNALVISGGGIRNGTSALTSQPAGYTLGPSTFGAGGGRATAIAHVVQAGAGTTGTATWTHVSNIGLAWQAALNGIVVVAGLQTVTPGVVADGSSLHAPVASSTVSVAPGVIADTSALYAPTVTAAAPSTNAVPTPIADGSALYAPTLSGATTASPGAIADTSATFAPTVAGAATASPGAIADSSAVYAPAVATATPTLVRRTLGIPSATAVPISTRTTAATSVRAQVSTSATFASGIISGSPVTPNAQGDSQLTVTGLTAGTAYYYRIGMTVSGVETFSSISSKTFKTAPTGQASFAFCLASCNDGVALDSAALTAIAARNDDFFLHLGDQFYADGSGTDLANFRTKYHAVLTGNTQTPVFSETPTDFRESDHDGMADNTNAGSAATAWTNHNTTIQELLPVASRATTSGSYYHWDYGRVRFIALDRRHFASSPAATDNSSKNSLGTVQEQWLQDRINEHPAGLPVVIVQESPWINAATAGSDGWEGFTTERTRLANFFSTCGRPIIMLAGDMHAVAADDGTNAPGGIAVFHAAPLRKTASIKGGPYSVSPYPASGTAEVQQYGRVVVTDSGSQISFAFTGYSSDNTQRVTLTETVTLPVTVTPGAIADGSSVAAPTVTAATIASPGAIASPAALYAPTVTATTTVTPGVAATGPTLHAPTVSTSVTAAPGVITSAPAVFSPSATAATTVAPGAIGDSSAVHPPTVVGAGQVSPTPIGDTSALYAPTISAAAPPAATVTPGHIADASAVLAPAVAGSVTVTPDGLATIDTVYGPVVVATVTLGPDPIGDAGAVHEPAASGALISTLRDLTLSIGRGRSRGLAVALPTSRGLGAAGASRTLNADPRE